MLNIKYKNINNECIYVNNFDQLSNDANEIDCSHNKLTCLPEFENLTNINIINCSNNLLIKLPEWKHLINLKIINCSNNKLTCLPEWENLSVINCSNNMLICLPEWNMSINLNIIDVSYNMLTYLFDWQHLINLKIIDCGNNQLNYLPEFEKLINLEEIHCKTNKLIYLPEWYTLTNLKIIYCVDNKLIKLPEWRELINLNKIYCSYNELTYLPNFEKLKNLDSIFCSYNQIISFPISWVRLINLRHIKYDNNPIEYIPPNLLRIINSNGQNIYEDKQSVHNHNIQICIYNSIQYLIKDKPSISIETMRQEIKNECISYQLLIDYCIDQTVHAELNVTFEEVLLSIWSKIRDNINKKEIIKVLNIEILDSECKCFTGRLTRLVNCLSGFDNNVIMQISDNEQMSNISKLLYNKYPNEKDYKRELRKEFEERGYSEENIIIWNDI